MQPDPITYPTVHLGDQDIELKYTVGAIIRLKKDYGLELDQIYKGVKGADMLEQTCQLIAAGVAHSCDMTVQQIADAITLIELPKYSAAVVEALKKATPQTEAAKPVVQ
jgi:hypothetical protein